MLIYDLDPKSTSVKSNYQLSLTNKWTSTSGFVSIYDTISKRASIICASNWNLNGADVVCRQLGYLGASGYGKYQHFLLWVFVTLFNELYLYYGLDSIQIPSSETSIIISLQCSGTESIIDQCKLNSNFVSCQGSQMAGVVCYVGQTKPFYG